MTFSVLRAKLKHIDIFRLLLTLNINITNLVLSCMNIERYQSINMLIFRKVFQKKFI